MIRSLACCAPPGRRCGTQLCNKHRCSSGHSFTAFLLTKHASPRTPGTATGAEPAPRPAPPPPAPAARPRSPAWPARPRTTGTPAPRPQLPLDTCRRTSYRHHRGATSWHRPGGLPRIHGENENGEGRCHHRHGHGNAVHQPPHHEPAGSHQNDTVNGARPLPGGHPQRRVTHAHRADPQLAGPPGHRRGDHVPGGEHQPVTQPVPRTRTLAIRPCGPQLTDPVPVNPHAASLPRQPHAVPPQEPDPGYGGGSSGPDPWPMSPICASLPVNRSTGCSVTLIR